MISLNLGVRAVLRAMVALLLLSIHN